MMHVCLFSKLHAYITEYPTTKYHASKQQGCPLRIMNSNKAGRSTYSVFFRKGSQWNHLISKTILSYKEKSVFVAFHNRWIKDTCSVDAKKTDILERFNINAFGGLLIILFGAFACTFLILCAENVAVKVGNHVSKPNSYEL